MYVAGSHNNNLPIYFTGAFIMRKKKISKEVKKLNNAVSNLFEELENTAISYKFYNNFISTEDLESAYDDNDEFKELLNTKEIVTTHNAIIDDIKSRYLTLANFLIHIVDISDITNDEYEYIFKDTSYSFIIQTIHLQLLIMDIPITDLREAIENFDLIG